MRIEKRIGWLLVSCLLFVSNWALAQDKESVVEGNLKLDHGQVDWTARTITATGSGAPDLKAPNVAVARLGAERVAKLDALRNILETLKGVKINSEVTVKNEMVTSSKMRSKIEGLARNFKVLKTKYYSDGGVDLVVQMSLDGPLASVLLEPGKKVTEISSTGAAKNTGLVIDARNLKIIPALAPRVLDENGNVIYSSEFVTKDALEQNGAVGYFRSVDAAKKAKRIGNKPLVIKALKPASDGNTDIVLSNADAEKLNTKDQNMKFLTEGKVIIVIN